MHKTMLTGENSLGKSATSVSRMRTSFTLKHSQCLVVNGTSKLFTSLLQVLRLFLDDRMIIVLPSDSCVCPIPFEQEDSGIPQGE